MKRLEPSGKAGGASSAVRLDAETLATDPDIAFLVRHGVSALALALATRIAALRGTTARAELFAARAFEEERFWRALAVEAGVPYRGPGSGLRPLSGGFRIGSEALRRCDAALALEGDTPVMLVAPRPGAAERLASLLQRVPPAVAERVRVASPKTIRALLLEAYSGAFAYLAVHRLARALPSFSAAEALRLPLHTLLLTIVALIGTAFALAPQATWLVLGGLLALLFLDGVVWKLAAAFHRESDPDPPPLAEADLPMAAVLVPLYREAAVVPDLMQALGRLDYPRSKLHILLIAEADDCETVAAIRAALSPPFDLIEVPNLPPRTKPKALVYALPFARGEHVVVYDAEDRPEPGQLRLAAAVARNFKWQSAQVQMASF